ncbi:MAG: RnfABCDGE type electron transport complex subunit G [Muribaculaceae bacterium]|nr:RnfABCDGE type electron transport complex subunit G [Muribaculaceae bacterium]
MKSSLLNMVLSLGIITIVAAGLLSWIFTITEQPIAQANLNKQIEAVKAVTPEFDNDPVAEAVEITPAGEDKALKVFPARKDGQLVGAAVESYSSKGFSGDIKLIYGFDQNGVITGYAVMEHAETPGLGAKMGDWFNEGGKGNVIGMNATEGSLTVSKDGGQVDAITAATITSRAFLDALNRAAAAFTALKAEEN